MKNILLFAALSFAAINYSTAQIICIYCYDQNDSISKGVNNLILNGSLEDNNCIPNSNAESFCPNSNNYTCDIKYWTCTGGGINTYASMWDPTLTVVPDGVEAAYFGNDFCKTCSNNTNDTSCLMNLGCSVTNIPAGYPKNSNFYGGPNGISLSQTVNGLIVGNTYVLEFWSGGEHYFYGEGMFAVDVGFGDTMLRCPSTPVGGVGREYIIEFNATSSSQTIKFTNWGHIRNDCTELILDNVRLYTLAELDISVPPCNGAATLPSSAFGASDTAFCKNFCVDFFDLSANNPTSWQWSFPGGNPSSSTSQNPTNICYNTPGIYDVTLITFNAAGSDTLTLQSYVTVSTPPTVTITQSNDTLYSSAGNSYQWFVNGNPINGATNDFYVPTAEDFYTVEITDSTGCSAADTIFFSLAPQTSFAGSDTTICQKFCMDFFDQSGNNPTSWKWNFPGGTPSSSTQQNPTQICYNNPGIYDVTLITTNTYGSDTLVLTGYITVYATPAFPTITVTGDILTSSYASSYQWQFNSVDIPGATNQSYTATQTGYYTVIITDENGCVSSTTVFVEVTGVENTGESSVLIYPNPASGSFFIEWNQIPAGEISIVVTNTLGQKTLSITEENHAPSLKKEIKLNGAAGGVYSVEIRANNFISVRKIIIE